ncbi:MAG: hypothetical protein AAF621_00475 [Pseudomonadota bacterium]
MSKKQSYKVKSPFVYANEIQTVKKTVQLTDKEAAMFAKRRFIEHPSASAATAKTSSKNTGTGNQNTGSSN